MSPFEKFKSLSTKRKVFLGLYAGVLGAAAINARPSRENQSDLSRSIKLQNTPNAVFQAFDYNKKPAPVVYNGSGFYNWENRTGHHKA